jgi:hypothetical protein
MVKAGCAITSLNAQPMKFGDVLVKLIEGNAGGSPASRP